MTSTKQQKKFRVKSKTNLTNFRTQKRSFHKIDFFQLPNAFCPIGKIAFCPIGKIACFLDSINLQ